MLFTGLGTEGRKTQTIEPIFQIFRQISSFLMSLSFSSFKRELKSL